jgi:hypothetical protein
MRLTKAMTVLACLSFAVNLAITQDKSSSPQTASEPNTTIPMIYWSQKPDVHKWLKENESLLNRGDGCTLYSSYFDEDKSFRTGQYSVVSFLTVPGDEEITKAIRDPVESGPEVRIGVRYSPTHLGFHFEIALAFEGVPEDVFDGTSGAQASTFRNQNWKRLAIERHVRVGHVLYDFLLSCQNGKTFMDTWRHPAKHKAHSKSSQ